MADDPLRQVPLNALRVFRAVMRWGSFRQAADDLLVSPQAVSQQIKQLEAVLGQPLFSRRGRVVDPTEAAILLAHHVEAGFAEFQTGLDRVRQAPPQSRITINVSPYFATRHLIPRLGQFQRAHPGADLRLTTTVELPDFARDEVDLSIQWGFGTWAGFEAQLLTPDPKVLCCTPDLAARLTAVSDLADVPLVHALAARDLWPRVLAFLGVAASKASGALEFQDAATLRRATLAGLGVGLVSTLDATNDLAAGRLVAPLGEDLLLGMDPAHIPGFFLVLPRAHRREAGVAAFCDWLTGQDWDTPPLP